MFLKLKNSMKCFYNSISVLGVDPLFRRYLLYYFYIKEILKS